MKQLIVMDQLWHLVRKAVGDVEEADEVAQVAVPMAAYPKKR